MDPTSQYDLIYKGMSEEDRERLDADIDAVIERSINSTKERMTKALEEAAKEIQGEMLCNVWGDWIRENSGSYDFIGALQSRLWKIALSSNPSEINEYRLKDLVASWRKNFPAEWAEIVNADAAKEIETIKESLKFERSINQRQQY